VELLDHMEILFLIYFLKNIYFYFILFIFIYLKKYLFDLRQASVAACGIFNAVCRRIFSCSE